MASHLLGVWPVNAKEQNQVADAIDTAIRYLRFQGANYIEKNLPHPQQLLLTKLEEARKKFPIKAVIYPSKYAGQNPNCHHSDVSVKWPWNPTVTKQCWTCGAYE